MESSVVGRRRLFPPRERTPSDEGFFRLEIYKSKPQMSESNSLPTQEYFNSILAYDPTIGVVTWHGKCAKNFVGKPAGSVSGGYLRLEHKGKTYSITRIIWMMTYGVDPGVDSIDHIDRDPLNNRLDNLRLRNASGQANNRGTNHLITHEGETLTIAEWARKLEFISSNALLLRIRKGWSIDRAFTTPLRPY